MAFYQAITTEAGSTLNYWDFGRIEFNTSDPDHANQSANVNMWGYHDISYRTAGSPPIDKNKSYSCNYVSGTDYYPYNTFDLTGISGEVTGTESVRSAPLPSGWSWTANSVSGWMADSSDIRNGAEAWALVCVPDFSGAVITGHAYPD